MKKIQRLVLGVLATVTTVVTAHAATPAGMWIFNGNGVGGVLSISETTGFVTGSLKFSSNGRTSLLKGFWTDSTGKLTFYLLPSGFSTTSAPPDQIQIYAGYMHPCNASSPTTCTALDGNFEAFSAGGGTPSKNLFGWHATK